MKRLFVIILICLSTVSIAQKKNLIVEGTAPDLYINHKVTSGESLFSLARKYNQSVQTIATYNNVASDKGLLLGQTIKVPLTAQNLSSPGETSEVSIPLYHVVGKNETLFRISNNMSAAVPDVKRWNNLASDNIASGTSLIVGHLKLGNGSTPTQGSTPTPVVEKAVTAKTEAPQQLKAVEEIKKDEASVPATNKEVKKEEAVVSTTKVGQKPAEQTAIIANTAPSAETQTPNTSLTATEKPSQQTAALSQPNKIDLLTPEPEVSNEGVFAEWYSSDVSQKSLANKVGEASTFKSSSGWQDKKYYVLVNDIPPGTILKIASPDNKVVFAKVLGSMPEMKENKGLLLRLSNAAASYLGMVDTKFPVQVSFYQ